MKTGYKISIAILLFALVLFIGKIPMSKNTLDVTFVDVGQGDCAIIKLPTNEIIMIDSGEADEADEAIEFLEENNIDTIDYLVATHPHSDHIGGMAEIVSRYNILNVYMPRVSHNTRMYEDLLYSIKEKGLKINTAKSGVVILDGSVRAEFLAPNNDYYEELNNYSAVLKITYGDVSFLFTGDAEKIAEEEMLKGGIDLSADVLKVGHHGSSTSTTKSFLNAVNPQYAVISADGESYGHPHKSVVKRLKDIAVFKTYEDGDITFKTDGINIEVER